MISNIYKFVPRWRPLGEYQRGRIIAQEFLSTASVQEIRNWWNASDADLQLNPDDQYAQAVRDVLRQRVDNG